MLNVSRSRPEPVEWVPAERLGGREVDAVLRPWLIGQGLLTQRLREKFRERFECQAGEPWTGLLSGEERAFLRSNDRAGLVREERLRVDGDDWVLCRTVLPDSTLTTHPWLAELGESSLPEVLAELAGVTRAPYEYARLAANAPHTGAAPGRRADDGLWARRTRLRVRGSPLALQEIFLPAAGGG